jgi:hypothetical protein
MALINDLIKFDYSNSITANKMKDDELKRKCIYAKNLHDVFFMLFSPLVFNNLIFVVVDCIVIFT